ncbi:MAG: ATP-binding cassette, subfamily bacterial [Thermomicrobiales bacterium]|nr:ATP-binding cassette, subfamily bacterial [Thermomicrobiales bacterium]
MKSEFRVAGQTAYDRRGPIRWIVSHFLHNRRFVVAVACGVVVHISLNTLIPGLVGQAFDAILETPPDRHTLGVIALVLLAITLLRGVVDLGQALSWEVLAKRMERDTRDELYVSLLGKSQTFHNRQRVGDLMARAANDVRQLNMMVNPGLALITESLFGLVIPIVFIGFLDWRLLLSPLLFAVAFAFALRRYMRQLNPVSGEMRKRFGMLNAGLTEAVTGIEVVKSTAQEGQERDKFSKSARSYRDAAVQQGVVQARYLPTLIMAVTSAAALCHGLYLVSKDELSPGGLVTYLGLIALLRFPTFISIFTFSLVQLGVVSAERILALIKEETELDENQAGHVAPIEGEIVFDNVTFGYGGEPVLKNVSFRAAPGETIAIVGETGSGKSTLTKLVPRIYDVDDGRILIDGVDVREWHLTSLRSQISTIEQDIVLFSRPVAENIAFSLGQRVEMEAIERAARDAQADGFIRALPEGYETTIGERGVTLSGGQRQRIAIARALLTDPRILIIDDSTSAIDSETEDQIQRAIRRVLEGRTTLLITHRLSQIRWADRVIVLRRGEVVDQGTHDELLVRCELYRRIFARYDWTPDEVEAGAVAVGVA